MQNWLGNTCVETGLKIYSERQSSTGTFLWKIFSEHLFIEHFQVPALSLLLESLIFWRFLSSNLPDVYLLVLWFTMHMFLFYLLSNTDHTNSFDSYKVCTLCSLIDLVFSFESMNWCTKEKKHEKSGEYFTPGLRKNIRIFNQVLFKKTYATKLKFSSTILQ